MDDAPGDDLETVRRYLAGLDAATLADRLVDAARRDDGLRLGLVTEARAATGSLDVAALKKQLTALLRVSSRHYHWRGAREWVEEAGAALDLLDGLLSAGHAGAVIPLAEHAIKRVDAAMSRIDDSGGFIADPVLRLQDIHRRACEAARPDVRKLAVRLIELELSLDWEWFLDAPERYADVLGPQGLQAFRLRIEKEWDAIGPLLPDATRRFAPRRHDGNRFTVTTLRESLARATGDIDDLVEVMSRDLASPYSFHRIASELERVGRERQAIQWLERGAAAFGIHADSRLRDHLIDAYLRDGQAADALAIAEQAFDNAATAESFRLLERVATAAGVWEERRPDAIVRLRERPGGYYRGTRSELAAVLLADGDVTGALREADEGGCEPRLRLELGHAAAEEHPDAAAEIYRLEVDRLLEGTQHYREAVALLKRWRTMLATHGREAEILAHVARLREEHRRRPSLLARLDKAGFVAA